MERQLRRRILEPARPLLTELIRQWRDRNLRILSSARGPEGNDPQTLERLNAEQANLMNTMLSESDLRKAVEMAFSMIHLAETGGDISRAPQIPGVPTATADLGGMRTLLDWYRRLTPEKQGAIRDVVSSVLRRADSQLYDFVVSMYEPGYFAGITRTYRMIKG